MLSVMEPKVIFEDSEILILDKPSGMTVNRADTTRNELTVQDWVEKKFRIQNSLQRRGSPEAAEFKIDAQSDFYKRAGIVHRLDKETSGVLIVAKNPQSFENLQGQFKERKVQKTYVALVHGKVQPSEGPPEARQGEIRVPVGRLPWNRKRFGVVAGGRDAVTRYKIQNSSVRQAQDKIQNEDVSLLELYPETGRTHQIRVHLKYAGHPVFSDPLYGGRKQARADRKILPRLFLHAVKLSLAHPKTGEKVTFESQLPEDLHEILPNRVI